MSDPYTEAMPLVRVDISILAAAALLASCTAQEPQAPVSNWSTLTERGEPARKLASENSSKPPDSAAEKESGSDCLRKGSVVDAWTCVSKD